MLSHVTIGVSDLPRAQTFYAAVLGTLGLVPKFSDDRWAAWKRPDAERPLFLITTPHDGRPATAGNGQMVALMAHSRAAVDRCHALALAHGGTDEGGPGLRPHYHPAYCGAYFRDPDANKLCVVCHEEE